MHIGQRSVAARGARGKQQTACSAGSMDTARLDAEASWLAETKW
jgi:hypothetical protein